MLKACTLFRFREGQDPEDAQKYWRTTHGDVLKGYPFYKRYIQSHPVLTHGANKDLPYDGLAEIWVENTQVLRDASSGPGYQAITDDEKKFIDRTYTDLILVEEHPVIDTVVKSDDVKLVHLIKRADGIDPASYQRKWVEQYGEAMVRSRKPSKLVVSLTKLGAYRDGSEPKWDVIVTEWHGSLVALPEGNGKLAMDIGASQIVTMVTREHLIAEFA